MAHQDFRIKYLCSWAAFEPLNSLARATIWLYSSLASRGRTDSRYCWVWGGGKVCYQVIWQEQKSAATAAQWMSVCCLTVNSSSSSCLKSRYWNSTAQCVRKSVINFYSFDMLVWCSSHIDISAVCKHTLRMVSSTLGTGSRGKEAWKL